MKTDLGHELTAAVMATADVFLRESQRLFRPHGLTAAQYNVLNILAATPDGISQRELGDRLVVDRSNVTGLLDRLEKIGWVRRTDDPQSQAPPEIDFLREKYGVGPVHAEDEPQGFSLRATGPVPECHMACQFPLITDLPQLALATHGLVPGVLPPGCSVRAGHGFIPLQPGHEVTAVQTGQQGGHSQPHSPLPHSGQ